MVIYFKTRKLQKTCSQKTEAVKKLGLQSGAKLLQRMMELKAAENLADISKVPPARCHELTGNRKGQFSVDLNHPFRLIFIPANNPLPENHEGGLDWLAITKIEIIEIVDTHK